MLISVIVPVYNGQKWLETCLRSLSMQSYRQIEIVVVNDGSTDQSAKIIGDFQKSDARLRVINQNNLGLSAARNSGLRVATGDYVMFLDADDNLETYAVSTLAEIVERGREDIVVFGSMALVEENACHRRDITVPDLAVRDRFYCGTEITEHAIFEEPCCAVYVWNKIFSRKFIEDGVIFDESIRFGEDRCFMFDVVADAQKLRFIHNGLHKYRISGSASMTGYYKNRHYERTEWKIKILRHIYESWSRNERITVTAKERLISWGTEYLCRAMQLLTDDEKRRIHAMYNDVMNVFYIR